MSSVLTVALCNGCFELEPECICSQLAVSPVYTPQRPGTLTPLQLSTSVGRGPNGKVRNVRAMGNPKFIKDGRKVLDQGFDIEAINRWQAEALRRGVTL